jgi:hypothetical protein
MGLSRSSDQRAFEKRMLPVRRGAPVSSFVAPGGNREKIISGGWYEAANGWWVIALATDGRDGPLGLTAFQWVRWPGVVQLLLHKVHLEDVADAHPEPTEKLLGFSPLTFEAALTFEKGRHERPMHSASHRWSDGAFTYSEVSVARRQYQFASANPEPDEEAIGVTIRLKT